MTHTLPVDLSFVELSDIGKMYRTKQEFYRLRDDPQHLYYERQAEKFEDLALKLHRLQCKELR